MCGIGGASLVNSARMDLSGFLQGVLQVQSHRGPDGQGIWISESQCDGLAHNRLSILGLGGQGHQPMISACNRYIISFNGEIYNYKEIRLKIEKSGYSFRTSGDTEVLLQGYILWGDSVLQYLRGMFAFAIFDTVKRSFFCARDPIGEKPFVYSITDDGVFFASEIPALKFVPGLNLTVDVSAISLMLIHNLRHIPDPWTGYKEIKRLQAGHAMIISNGRVERLWRHWTPVSEAGHVSAHQLRDMLDLVISEQVQADVPVGALLSGGVDSTAIVGMMRKYTSGRVQTYALGAHRDDEDLVRARRAASYLGTNHQEFYFDPDEQWDILNKIIKTYGDPIMLLPMTHSYVLARAIQKDGVKVVLNGNGADELFYGYSGHIRTAWISRFLDVTLPLSPLLNLILPESVSWIGAPIGERKAVWYRSKVYQMLDKVLSKFALEEIEDKIFSLMSGWGRLCPTSHYIDESNFVGLMVENTHSVTTIGDLPPMMAGVEMRAPFLDQRIVSLAFAASPSQKIPLMAKSNNLKYILRQAVSGIVPQDLLNAPKRGFGMGIQERNLHKGVWRDRIHAIIDNENVLPNFFDTEKVQTLKNNNDMVSLIFKIMSIKLWAI